MKRAALLLVLLLPGCAAVGPTPDPRSVTAPTSFALAAPGTSDADRAPLAVLLPEEDPAYRALVAAALDNAPDLALALARVEAARAAARAAGAARAPNIGIEGSAARQRSSENALINVPPGLAIDTVNTSFSLGISASWDADLFGRLRASQQAAQLRLDAADADARAVRLALRTDIARAVTDYRAAEAQLALVQTDLADARTLAALTGARVRAGLAPGIDLVRAEGLAAAARAETGPARAAQASALGQLVTLTALGGPEVQAALAAVPAAPAGLPPVPAVGLPSTLLRARPDMVAAEARLQAANRDVAAAAAARFPQLSITAALGVAALALGDLFSADSLTAQLGAGVAAPLLDFGRVGAQIDARQADAQAAFAAYRQSLFRAIGESEAALGSEAAARERLAALTVQQRIDADALALATQRYRIGLSDFLTVVDAQRQLNRTRQQRVAADAAVRQAAITLYRSFGG
jgi:NodT family efflux transporter outer membrane factor (OMF) lipoprotein